MVPSSLVVLTLSSVCRLYPNNTSSAGLLIALNFATMEIGDSSIHTGRLTDYKPSILFGLGDLTPCPWKSLKPREA